MATLPKHTVPLEVFFSYAHEDEPLRDKLAKHLSALERQRVITSWHDRRISAGTEWAGQIDTHLNTARIILLLVSPDFIASDYCYDVELQRVMERHDAGGVRVIPIILRPTDWKDTPFAKLQALPQDGKPITTWTNEDEAFLNVTEAIRHVAQELHSIAPFIADTTPTDNRGKMLVKMRKIVRRRLERRRCRIQPDLFARTDLVRNPLITESIQPRKIPKSKPILDILDEQTNSLLILGESGSGKSQLLLQFARAMLFRAERDIRKPIPVLFNLSSWINKYNGLEDWLIDELWRLYGVPVQVGQAWVMQEKKIIPLLDGLDELSIERQDKCVTIINEFNQNNGFDVQMIVSCRMVAYQQIVEQGLKLNFGAALVVQPLEREQINAFLDCRNDLSGLQAVLAGGDSVLYELARIPLWLDIMSQVYKDRSAKELSIHISREELIETLCARYIEKSIAKEQEDVQYSEKQILRWLQWLAQEMKYRSQSIFLIEQLQPDYLPSRKVVWQYLLLDRLGVALLAGIVLALGFGLMTFFYGKATNQHPGYYNNLVIDSFVFGLIGFMIGGLFSGRDDESRTTKQRVKWSSIYNIALGSIVFGLIGYLISGLTSEAYFFALMGGIPSALAGHLGVRQRQIGRVERLEWNRDHFIQLMPGSIIAGGIIGLIVGTYWKSIDGFIGRIAQGPIAGLIAGVILGLLLSLVFGRMPREVTIRDIPNKGIILSAQSASWAAAQGAVVGGIFGLLVAEGPISWLIFGLIGCLICALAYGGYACLSHLALRFVLTLHNCIPWDYTRFLNYADKGALMIKQGGAYVFDPLILRDYLAKPSPESVDERDPINHGVYITSVTTTPPGANWLKSIGLVLALAVFVFGLRLLISAVTPADNYDVTLHGYDSITDVADINRKYNGIKSSILVHHNTHVYITAEGVMHMNAYSLNVSPDGYYRGFMGIPLSSPNARRLVENPDFPRGVLLCRVRVVNQPWHKCGSSTDFIVEADGILEFMINDDDTTTHEGAFGITVKASPL